LGEKWEEEKKKKKKKKKRARDVMGVLGVSDWSD
jgi:hypothetical protein